MLGQVLSLYISFVRLEQVTLCEVGLGLFGKVT
jgi:hypothetical protein